MARKLPDPAERSAKDPAVICKNDRVLALYNTNHTVKAEKISATVRDWFLETAKEEGWDAAFFLKDVETRHSAGCVLYKKVGEVPLAPAGFISQE